MSKLCLLFFACFTVVNCEKNPLVEELSLSVLLPKLGKLLLGENDSITDGDLCRRHLYDVLLANEKADLWAQLVLDSDVILESGLIIGRRMILGLFEECLRQKQPRLEFTGQYCLIRVNIPALNNYYPKTIENDYPATILWGTCLPSTCTPGYLMNFTNSIQLPSTDYSLHDYVSFKITERDCISYDPDDFTMSFILLAIVVSLSVVGMSSSIYLRFRKTPSAPQRFKIMSIDENMGKLMKEKKSHPYEMGLAALGTFWAVANTVSRSIYSGPVINSIEWHQSMTKREFLFFNNSERGQDLMLFVAGLVVVRKFYKSVSSRRGYDHIITVLKTYLKWTVPLGVCVVFATWLLPIFGGGPVWTLTLDWFYSPCMSNWPYVITYSQNYLNDLNQCLRQTWLFAVEMQLLILSPFLLYPLTWSIPCSIIITLCSAVATTCFEFYIALSNDLGPSYNFTRDSNFILLDYYKTHTRATPWLIGCFCGQMIAYSQKKKIKPSQAVFFIGSLFCLLFLGVSLFSLLSFDREYQQPAAAITLAGNRLLWALAIAWITFTAAIYRSGWISTFLSLSPFHLMGKLSFCTYALHEIVTHHGKGLERKPRHKWMFEAMCDFGVVYTLSLTLAFYLAVCVEYPTRRMVNHFFENKSVGSFGGKTTSFTEEADIEKEAISDFVNGNRIKNL